MLKFVKIKCDFVLFIFTSNIVICLPDGGLLRSLLGLFKNPVYMCLIFGFAISNLYTGGFLVFIPKYTQEQFSMSAPRAIIITALISGIGTGVSGILGGQIVSWLKLSVRGLFLMIIILSALLVASSMATVFLGCENLAIDGVSNAHSDLESSCNRDCGCDQSLYSPVCDDGVTYFTSCHAGCVEQNVTQGENVHGMFWSCSCTASGTATPGACPTGCTMLIPACVLIICVFLGNGAIFPAMYLLLMRVVDVRYTSLALGLSTMATALLGWMPGGSVYGAIIDTTCLVWQKTSSGEAGFCWIYDLPAFRYKIMGLNTGCIVVLLVFVLISFMIHKRSTLGNYSLPRS